MSEAARDQYIQERGGRKNGYWRGSLQTELGKSSSCGLHAADKRWRSRPLPRRLAVLYIDAGFFDVRRDTVKKEAVYFVLGVDAQARREIIHFMVAPSESEAAWKEVLEELSQRGLQEVEFIVADRLAGLREAAPMAGFHFTKICLYVLKKKSKYFHITFLAIESSARSESIL